MIEAPERKGKDKMTRKDFSGNRINVYVPDEMRLKIEDVATRLIERGEQGLIKRDGSVNVSALFERLLDRELRDNGATP